MPASAPGVSAGVSWGYTNPFPSWCYYKPASKPLTVYFSLTAVAAAGAVPTSVSFEIHGKKTPFFGPPSNQLTSSLTVVFRSRGKYPYRFRYSTGVETKILGYFIVK